MSDWKECAVELPKDGQAVLAYLHDRATHHETDILDVRAHAAIFRQGRTPEQIGDGPEKQADQAGHNRKPYLFEKPLGGYWYGQDVTHWIPLPAGPTETAGSN